VIFVVEFSQLEACYCLSTGDIKWWWPINFS